MANLTTGFTDSTSSDASQSLFNTLLLRRGLPMLIHQVGVKTYPLARRSGKTMIWRRFEELAVATTPLSEGINPAGKTKTKTDVSALLAPYGDFIEDSDFLLSTQPDPHAVENVELLGEQMGRTFDQLYRDTWTGLTNTTFANGTTTLTVTQIVDRNDLDRAYRALMSRNALKFTPMVMASDAVGTHSIMPAYWAMVDEDVAFDLRHLDGFVLASEYGSSTGLLEGEFGADKNGIRFLGSSQGYVLPGATGVTAAATDVINTGGFADIYSIFIVGRDFGGGVSLAGDNGRVITQPVGSAGAGDPLEMRQTMGWKKYDARVILNAAFAQEIQCAASL
jgi:N4-gp56 family major capsid protein